MRRALFPPANSVSAKIAEDRSWKKLSFHLSSPYQHVFFSSYYHRSNQKKFGIPIPDIMSISLAGQHWPQFDTFFSFCAWFLLVISLQPRSNSIEIEIQKFIYSFLIVRQLQEFDWSASFSFDLSSSSHCNRNQTRSRLKFKNSSIRVSSFDNCKNFFFFWVDSCSLCHLSGDREWSAFKKKLRLRVCVSIFDARLISKFFLPILAVSPVALMKRMVAQSRRWYDFFQDIGK